MRGARVRLAMTYLAIIMLMSIGFSVVFYHTSYNQIGRQLPPRSLYQRALIPDDFRPGVEDFIQQRISEARNDLLVRLVWVNLIVLVAGGALSYILAKHTLRPIEEAMEAQSQFVSDASHELRTPLTAIKTSNEVALRKPKLTLTEAKEIISQNTDDITKLQSLTEALLSLAQNGRHPAPSASISVQSVVSEALSQVVSAAQSKKLKIDDKSPNLAVLADQASLVQVIVNLLDNAIKYSEPNKTISIDGGQQDHHGYISITDQGVGVSDADLPHIFKRFYRTDRSRSKEKQNGYGLGLAIADQLIRQHGGEITAESIEGGGSRFTIFLPLASV